MISFPNCKINLGLNVLGKREDGYHDIETVFYPVKFCDALEVVQSNSFRFTSSGLNIDAAADENICVKAYRLLKNKFPRLPEINLHLHKTIPAGSGLGGGSADGAFTLKILSEKFDLGLNQQQLLDLAAELGSDCPFFIINKACYAGGRGEILEPIEIDLSGFHLALIIPNIHVSTKWAFSQLTVNKKTKSIREIIKLPVRDWKNELENDFEEIVSGEYSAIKEIKAELYKKGAVYASMSGSGSTVYGIFAKENLPTLSFPENYFMKWLPG